MSRMEILEKALDNPCDENCNRQWLQCAKQLLTWSVQNRHKTRKELDYCLKWCLILNKLEVLCIYGHTNAIVAVPSFPYNFTMQAHNLWFLRVSIANEFIATIVTSLQTKQWQQMVQIISRDREHLGIACGCSCSGSSI